MINNYLHSDITDKIIRSYYSVYNSLGFGFLEKVYENSMLVELRKYGLCCFSQHLVKVYYELNEVGYYFADIVVDKVVIIEIKAAESLCGQHEAQLTNYLKASEIEVGVLLNFGRKPEFRRKVFHSEYKKTHHKLS